MTRNIFMASSINFMLLSGSAVVVILVEVTPPWFFNIFMWLRSFETRHASVTIFTFCGHATLISQLCSRVMPHQFSFGVTPRHATTIFFLSPATHLRLFPSSAGRYFLEGDWGAPLPSLSKSILNLKAQLNQPNRIFSHSLSTPFLQPRRTKRRHRPGQHVHKQYKFLLYVLPSLHLIGFTELCCSNSYMCWCWWVCILCILTRVKAHL